MIDLVIASLDLVEGIEDCELVIVCDKMKIIEPDKKIYWKSGKVNEESQSRYEQYIQNLRDKYVKDTNSATDQSSESDTNCDTKKISVTGKGVLQVDNGIKSVSLENGGIIQ